MPGRDLDHNGLYGGLRPLSGLTGLTSFFFFVCLAEIWTTMECMETSVLSVAWRDSFSCEHPVPLDEHFAVVALCHYGGHSGKEHTQRALPAADTPLCRRDLSYNSLTVDDTAPLSGKSIGPGNL